MKLNIHINNPGLLIAVVFLVSAAVMAISSPSVYAGENTDSVVLVHLVFENERWALGTDAVSLLPCAAPSKFIQGTSEDPLILVLGSNNEKPLYQQNMRNPRLILIEEPSEEPSLLNSVSFKLRFPLVNGMETLQFWYDPVEQKEPSVVVDLREAIQRYLDAGGPNQKAPCQQPVIDYLPQ